MRFCRRFDEALRGNTGMNSKFDERYEIRPAAAKDIGQIMTFIGTFWKKGHILAVNRSFFEYEFLEADGSVNFLLAIDREKGSVEGILGYLKASHDAECMDIWGSIWKVKEGNTPLLGLELALRMEELIPFRYRLGIGSNPKTSIPFMKLFPGRKVSKMKHFYRCVFRMPGTIGSIPWIQAAVVLFLEKQIFCRGLWRTSFLMCW